MKIYTLKAEKRIHKNPILFVHGAMHGAWCWQKFFMPYFQENGFDVYAIDLTNHCDNQKNSSLKLTTINTYVEDIKEAIKEIREEVILVGHSMGGLVVQKFLENNNCHKAILLASVPPIGLLKTTFRVAFKNPLGFILGNLTWSLLPILGSKKMAKWAFFSHNINQGVFELTMKNLQDESYLAYLGMIVTFLNKSNKNVPILVLAAKNDNLIPLKDVRKNASFHNTEAIVFDMAHDMMLENNWEEVASSIKDWL